MALSMRDKAKAKTAAAKTLQGQKPPKPKPSSANGSEPKQAVAIAPKDGTVPIWFDMTTGAYFSRNDHGEFMRYPERTLNLLLREAGFSDKHQHINGLSFLEAELLRITKAQSVHFAGPLGGYEPGLYEMGGNRILLTTKPNVPTPTPGKWDTLKDFIRQLLGEHARYFFAWLKCAHESLARGRPFNPGQLLALAGPGGSGKSLLQSLITIMLAGRVSSPYKYMTGKTNFNAEVYSAEHGLIGDQNHKRDKASRRNFGAAIKEIVANPEAQIRGLWKSGITLLPFVRLTLSLNDNPLALLVLPEMDEDVSDKIMLLRARKVVFPWPSKRFPDKYSYGKTLVAEIPTMLWHLKRWNIHESIRDERYGVTSFKAPELIREVAKVSSEAKVWSLVQMYLWSDPEHQRWHGTAAELERLLRDRVKGDSLDRLFDYPGALGWYLQLLSVEMPDKIQITTNKKKKNEYTIERE